jgi:DNA-binding SARP family transcriptional activator
MPASRNNNKSQREERLIPASSAPDVYGFDALGDLIREGRYDQAVDLFRKARERGSQGDNPVFSGMLDSAYGMCLALEMFRAIFNSQDRVINQIKQNEIEMALQLERMLKQVKEHAERGVLRSTAGKSGNGYLYQDAKELKSGCAPGGSGLKKLLHSLLARSVPNRSEKDKPLGSPEPFDHNELFAVYCLGPFRVYHEDQMVTEWNGGKGLCIFKYLVANIGKPVAKDILMEVFWPDADPEASRRNLHQAIYCLRESFRRPSPEIQYIHYKNDCYSISPDVVTWIDADEFEKHVRLGRRLETTGNIREAMEEYAIAEELFQGDFMEEELYADWPVTRRNHLRDLYLKIADLLAGFHIREENYLSAISICRKLLTHDPCSEEAHLRLMQSYLAQGQAQLAIRQFHTCVQALKKELDVPPSPEIRNMYDRIISARRKQPPPPGSSSQF